MHEGVSDDNVKVVEGKNEYGIGVDDREESRCDSNRRHL